MTVKLGRMPLDEGLISPQQLQQALEHQRVNGGQLAAALIHLGFVRDEVLTQAISRKCGVPSVDLEKCEVDPAVLKLIPPTWRGSTRCCPSRAPVRPSPWSWPTRPTVPPRTPCGS